MVGIDIAGVYTINDGAGLDVINIGSTSLNPNFYLDGSGRCFQPGQIGFMAGRNPDPGLYANTIASTWQVQNNFNNVTYNVGSGFNTSTGRFTAPVAGTYMFTSAAYILKNTATVGYFIYVYIAMNGSVYILDPRGWEGTPGAYVADGAISDLWHMNVGDYAELWYYNTYTANNGFQPYEGYQSFSGFLIG